MVETLIFVSNVVEYVFLLINIFLIVRVAIDSRRKANANPKFRQYMQMRDTPFVYKQPRLSDGQIKVETIKKQAKPNISEQEALKVKGNKGEAEGVLKIGNSQSSIQRKKLPKDKVPIKGDQNNNKNEGGEANKKSTINLNTRKRPGVSPLDEWLGREQNDDQWGELKPVKKGDAKKKKSRGKPRKRDLDEPEILEKVGKNSEAKQVRTIKEKQEKLKLKVCAQDWTLIIREWECSRGTRK